MILRDITDELSRSTVLTLLLGTALDTETPALLDPRALDRMLAWSRKQPGRDFDLSAAPLQPAHRDALPERRDRLDGALARWQRNGWQVIGRDEPAYPKRVRRRLGAESPMLFVQGDQALVGCGGIALVCGTADGDAVGRDDILSAMAGSTLALIQRQDGSGSILIERPATSATAILRLSPPDQHDRGSDTSLDQSCHALADAVVVSGLRRDDASWDAIVALVAEQRQPVWVKGTGGDAALLIRAGARPILPGSLADDPAILLRPLLSTQARRRTSSAPTSEPVFGVGAPERMMRPALVQGFAEIQARFGSPTLLSRTDPPVRTLHLRLVDGAPRPGQAAVVAPEPSGPTLFDLFSERLDSLLSHGPLGAAVIADTMDLTRAQVDAWLMRVETAGGVRFDPQTRLYGRPD